MNCWNLFCYLIFVHSEIYILGICQKRFHRRFWWKCTNPQLSQNSWSPLTLYWKALQTFSKTFVTLLKSLWIEWNTLENTSKCPLLKNLEASFQLSNPLKLSWNYLKTIFFERTLKRSWQAWNFFERCLKHPLITLDPSLKCHWNILETSYKNLWNTLGTPLRHPWDS